MNREYVELRNGGYYVAGTRISLDSLAYLYREGASAEDIQSGFPALSLEQIHGAIAFYLANQKQVDENIAEGERELARLVPALEHSRPELYSRLQRARHDLRR